MIEELIHANAQMLASAGAVTELPSDAVRAAVVAALLDHAASGKIHTDWSVDPALLVHASLEAQLAQGLGVLERSEQLWWIARLAAAGRCTGLAAALAEAAVDTQWYAYARRAAVIAVGELGDDAIMAELALILEQDDGPNVQLRAAVIDVLYPALMSTQVLVAALRPQPERMGDYNYDRTLSGLADRIPPADLPVALDWLGHLDDKPTTRRYGRLVEGLLQKAWDHSDDPDIRRALAHLLASGGWRLLSGERLTLPWREGEADRRRSLVLETAAVQADSWTAITLTGLLRSDDLEWILDQIDTCPQPIAASLAECLTRSSFDEVIAGTSFGPTYGRFRPHISIFGRLITEEFWPHLVAEHGRRSSPDKRRSSSLALRALHVDPLLVDGRVGRDRGGASRDQADNGWGQYLPDTSPFHPGGAKTRSPVGPRVTPETRRGDRSAR